ncbi:MAG: nucleoside-diphosphate kinase [Ignavibacteria bacterium]|jgi:nucleoside-diphosphate kinase|nr:nucleoside-diphosphate kinase [Ignavibacteria bacterium]
MKERTLAILKPDCLEKKVQGKVIQQILDAGFDIKGMRLIHLSEDSAQNFYAIHKERPFYKDLVAYMISGPVVPLYLEKDNAVADFRKLIGATNPANAEEGTIRKLYAESIERNIVHGSDSDENASNEIAHFFNDTDIV